MQHLLDHARSFPNQVAHQLERLLNYPCIGPRASEGRLSLHAWFYEADTGTVLAHRPHADELLPL